MQTPSEQEIEAYLAGKPVSAEFLNELESRTSNLLTRLNEVWNPDRASEGMAELFKQADAISEQPHYQEQVSVDGLDNSNADSLPTTEQTER